MQRLGGLAGTTLQDTGDPEGPPAREQGVFLWKGREQQGQSEVKTLFSPRP